MANSKMTRKTALAMALEVLPTDFDAEARESLEGLLTQLRKPRTTSEEGSKAHKENLELAEKLRRALPANGVFSNKDIREKFDIGFPVGTDGKVSPNKVNAILKVAVNEGLMTRTKVGNIFLYRVA